MKTFVYLIFTCFISTGCFMAALGSKTPLLLYAVGFGIWALFLWGCSNRMKKKAEKERDEQQFNEFMRTKRTKINR
jgi:hypothetical protein